MNSGVAITTAVTTKEAVGKSAGSCSEAIVVGIDKMQVRMDFPNSMAPEYVQIQQWARSVHSGEFGKKHRVWTRPGRSQTNVFQELEGGGSLFTLYGKHRGVFRAWFQFNPNQVVMAELEGRLNTMLDKGFMSLLERGVVTYCEFAIDVPNAQLEDFVFVSRSHREQDLSWIGKGGIYIGSRHHGDLYFHVYDKRRQLREVKDVSVDHPLLRIEARVRGKRRFPFSGVLSQANPFASLLVVQRSLAEQLMDDGLLGNMFHLQGSPHELQYQISCLGIADRKPLVERFSNFEVQWWSPDSLWGKLGGSLSWVVEGVKYSGWV